MPDSIQNASGWTLRRLLQNTYFHFPNRFEYARRDVLKSIRIKTVRVYGNLEPGQARTKYIIESSSYPQYAPYYTQYDSRGRPRSRQRSYKHYYDVTIQLDELSLDSDRVKLRTGADKKWRFGSDNRARKDSRGRVIEGTNQKLGINGDFFFRLSWVYREEGILFGRNWANGAPTKTNPNRVVFLDKHLINAVEQLVNRGILQ